MARDKTLYTCRECGGTSPKWLGKCPHCNAWNTLDETVPEPAAAAGAAGRNTRFQALARSQLGGELADQTGRRIQRGEGDAGDGGGQGEGQVDHRVDDLAPGEAVAHQHPGQQGTDHAVEHGGGEGGGEAQLEGGQHARCADDGPEFGPTELGGVHEHGTQGNQHQQAEVHQGVAQRQPEAGYDGGNAA